MYADSNFYAIEQTKQLGFFFYNEQDRPGAQEEVDMLHDCFKGIRFKTCEKIPWTKVVELYELFPNHIPDRIQKHSVIVIGVMSHGNGGKLFDADGKSMPINDILGRLEGIVPEGIPMVSGILHCRLFRKWNLHTL